MIAIINYGLGNIKAFGNIYHKLNIPFSIATKSEDLKGATKIILPGVGDYDYAMERLDKSGMREPLDALVLEKKLPVLGICVGMQILANSSEEGELAGLGWIDAKVKKFDTSKFKQTTKIPHMGWNDVAPVKTNGLFNGLETNALFYFLHSYYFECNKEEDALAVANYGGEFACAAHHENIYGVQFHPEKSHQYGIQLLNNFANL
jgi:imidazole glycerol-phosphate synthase subunit HisH